MVHGQSLRPYKNTPRPPWISPEQWARYTRKQRDDICKEWEPLRRQLEEGEEVPGIGGKSSSSSAAPAAATDDDLAPWRFVPAMPTMPCANGRRPHVLDDELPLSAVVARLVGKAEIRSTPAAQEALLKEWTKLRQAGCWDESKVREWSDVASEARRDNTTMHVGLIFEICVEKGSELAPGDPNRKYKGRVVSRATTSRTKTGTPLSSRS